jgi:hypothetical protein
MESRSGYRKFLMTSNTPLEDVCLIRVRVGGEADGLSTRLNMLHLRRIVFASISVCFYANDLF